MAAYHEDSSYYVALLGVTQDASVDEIERARRRMAKQYHPDLRPNDPAAETLFKAINAACDTLIDSARRAQSRGQPAAQHSGGYRAGDCEYKTTITLAEARMGAVRTFHFHDGRGNPYSIYIQIPAGVRTGSVVRVAGAGGPSADGCRRGDLLVRIAVD
jgi:curved DNA-binding protein